MEMKANAYHLGGRSDLGTKLEFYGGDGKVRLSLGTQSNDGPHIGMFDKRGNVRIGMGMIKTLTYKPQGNRNRRVSKELVPMMLVAKEDGEVVWEAPDRSRDKRKC